jgi:hypothetical protein
VCARVRVRVRVCACVRVRVRETRRKHGFKGLNTHLLRVLAKRAAFSRSRATKLVSGCPMTSA